MRQAGSKEERSFCYRSRRGERIEEFIGIFSLRSYYKRVRIFSSNGKYITVAVAYQIGNSNPLPSFTGLPRSSLVLTIAISVIKLHRVVRGYPWRVPWMRRQSCPKNFVSSSLSTESNRSLFFSQNKSSCPSFQRFDRKNTFSKSNTNLECRCKIEWKKNQRILGTPPILSFRSNSSFQ